MSPVLLKLAAEYRPVAILVGLVLLVKRSPADAESFAAAFVGWLSQLGTFLTDPENAIGLALIALALRPRRGAIVSRPEAP